MKYIPLLIPECSSTYPPLRKVFIAYTFSSNDLGPGLNNTLEEITKISTFNDYVKPDVMKRFSEIVKDKVKKTSEFFEHFNQF